MKKSFFILIIGALIAGVYFYLQSPPKFEGEYARLHENIWKFAKTTNAKERLSIAMEIQMAMALSTLRPAEPMDLSDKEEKTAYEAKELLDSTIQRVRDFESSLTADDIATITKNNPDSFFRHAGLFSTTNLEKKCTKEQYWAIREKIGIRELIERGPYVGSLVAILDSRFHADYTQKVIDLLKKDSRFANFQELANTYYVVQIELSKNIQNLSGNDNDSRQKNYTEKLIKTGIEKENVMDYAFKLAEQSPECLGKISFDFFNFMNEDVTQTRGKFILSKLQEYLKTRGHLPEDIDDLPIDKSDSLFGSTLDGWYRPFYLSKGNKIVKLYSLGKDKKEGTADDIFIGEI